MIWKEVLNIEMDMQFLGYVRAYKEGANSIEVHNIVPRKSCKHSVKYSSGHMGLTVLSPSRPGVVNRTFPTAVRRGDHCVFRGKKKLIFFRNAE